MSVVVTDGAAVDGQVPFDNCPFDRAIQTFSIAAFRPQTCAAQTNGVEPPGVKVVDGDAVVE